MDSEGGFRGLLSL